MSVILRSLDGDVNVLKDVINGCGFLKNGETVTVETDQTSPFNSSLTCNAIKIKDSNNQMLFELDVSTTTATTGRFGVWYAQDAFKSDADDSTGNGPARELNQAIGCENGVIIRLRYGTTSGGTVKSISIVMMRTNLGKIAFNAEMTSKNSSGATSNGTTRTTVAFGDVAPFNTVTYDATSTRPQSEIAPILTSADIDTLSYTLKGGWLVYHSDRSYYLRQCIVNGKTYITDGMYAIEV